MNPIATTIKATCNLLKNKLIALIMLFILTSVYRGLPADQPIPFAELLYAVILVSSVTILAPVMRLLVFPEVAHYAEGSGLTGDLQGVTFTPGLVHYWIATVICYLTSLMCVSALLAH